MHLSEGVVVAEMESCSNNDDSLHKRRHRNRFSCYRAIHNHAMPLLLMVAVLTMLPYQTHSIAEVTTTFNPIGYNENFTTEETAETTIIIMETPQKLAKTETNNTETASIASNGSNFNKTISTQHEEEDEENEIFTTLDDGILKEIKMSPVFVKPKSREDFTRQDIPKPEVEQKSRKDLIILEYPLENQLIDETETAVVQEDETIVITTSTTEINGRDSTDPTRTSFETSTVAINDGNGLRDSRNLNFDIKQSLNSLGDANEETNTVEVVKIRSQSIDNKFDIKLSEFRTPASVTISEETEDYENSLDSSNIQQLLESTKLDEHSKSEVVSSINDVTTAVVAEETSATTYIPELPETVTTSESDELSIVLNETLSATDTEPPITSIDTKEQDLITLEKYISESSAIATTIAPEKTVHSVIKKQGVDLSYEDIFSETTTVSAEDENRNENINAAEVLQDVYTTTPSNDPVINENAFDLDVSTSSVGVLDYQSTTDLPEEEATTEFVIATKAEPVTVQHNHLEDVPEVFSGEEMATASIKGSRSINMANSAHFDDTAATLFAGQTIWHDNLAAESSGGIVGKALPTISLNDDSDSPNRSFIIIVLCSSTALLFIAISVVIFLVSFQRQHGTLDIEMQEQRCGKDDLNDEDAETCMKLLEVELPQPATGAGIDETDECL